MLKKFITLQSYYYFFISANAQSDSTFWPKISGSADVYYRYNLANPKRL